MSNSKIAEADLWSWLRKAESELGRKLHMRRVENLVGVGDADVSGVLEHVYFDIELKTAERPARGNTAILNSARRYVRPEQKVWHRCRWLAGGNNFVLLQVGSGSDAWRYMFRGDALYNNGIEDKTEGELAAMSILVGDRPRDILYRAVTYRSTCNL